MTEPLPSRYDPKSIETELYAAWRDSGCFAVGAHDPGEPYVIQMPPPNVTAVLHAGHGLTYTVQDVLIRFQRMTGRRALWVPGTDHAGIATQNVVEKQLALEGKTRFDLGREAFEARVRNFVSETGKVILQQLGALGSSCDWNRTYFTLDPKMSRAVRETFVTLYEQGLIYRGKYIINWCPRCLTALSNEEVEKVETEGSIWHLRYPMADGNGSIVVATTRPETMLGDTGVAVHPDDPRYQALVGRELDLPLTGRRIPVVADSAVEKDFGTGAVKVTPAHDPTDFEIGRRAGLDTIDVMTDDARINDHAPEAFRGLDRNEARRKVVAEFDKLGLLVKVEKHQHAVGHCYRCDTVVEPRLSDQWFVNMKPLADPALQAYRDGRLSFLPERQGDSYTMWLENIRDWVISRQLWWGHRIPVWYCDAPGCGERVVSREDPSGDCPRCGGALRQDPDVLDTWFSSWLVPFSSLGWPDETDDLRAFYPGHTMVTAPEILFFWVARMIMAGLHFRGEVPFSTIYLHGTVRDTQHRKMSKSLGNGVDPLEVIDRFGADAFRYTMVSGMAVGTDVILDPDDLDTSFASGRNFANKLWNIGRLILGHLDADTPRLKDVPESELQLADRWILARADEAIRTATDHYRKFRLNDAASTVYHFLWGDLADWYLEAAKPRLYGKEEGAAAARAVAAHSFDLALRMMHPVMPFITEALWQRLPHRNAGEWLMSASWPVEHGSDHGAAVSDFEHLQSAITALRLRRATDKVSPAETRPAVVQGAPTAIRGLLDSNAGMIQRLARVDSLHFVDGDTAVVGETVLLDGQPVTFALQQTETDRAAERERISREVERLGKLVSAQQGKLANEAFTSRAPAAVVEREREKLAALITERDALQRQLADQ